MKQILRVAAVTIGALVMSNSFADGHGHHAKSDIDTVLAAQSMNTRRVIVLAIQKKH